MSSNFSSKSKKSNTKITMAHPLQANPIPTPFSIDRTFSASSEFLDYDDEAKGGPFISVSGKDEQVELPVANYFTPFDDDPELISAQCVEGNAENVQEIISNEEEYFQQAPSGPAFETERDQDKPFELCTKTSGNKCSDDGNNTSKVRRVHRKKSILRHTHDKSGGGSANSFNGSACGSSIISDGKMGSFNSQFYNDFYNRAATRQDFQRYTRGALAPLDRCNSTSASSAQSTIAQHYYPEGGWGWIILLTAMFSHILLCGFLLSGGIFSVKVLERFGSELRMECVWLTSLSLGLSLALAPLWVSVCTRKSTRLSAVFGGLVTSLGCLFTSFASQYHQLYFSYVIFMGVGVGFTRDASNLMVGQYFKRKRDFVEILLVSSSGIGILVMSISIQYAVNGIGWRLGLQSVTGVLALTFFLGSCYRSASLYHPQRRAIIHLKNQKRKIKEKEKKNDGPPFLDTSCLSSQHLQILLFSCFLKALGLYSPLFLMVFESQEDGTVDETDWLLLYIYIGGGWTLGSIIFGFLAMQNQRNEECRISKFYLCQTAALLTALSILSLTSIKDESSFVTFAWAYGIGLGGYNCVLKLHVFERVRARVFPRAWSFVEGVQGVALVGIPVSGYINTYGGAKKGYFLSAGCIFLGIFIMFLNATGSVLARQKSNQSSMKTCETADSGQSPGVRRISFTFPDERLSPQRISKDDRSISSVSSDRSRNGSQARGEQKMAKELTRISEEGILDTNH